MLNVPDWVRRELEVARYPVPGSSGAQRSRRSEGRRRALSLDGFTGSPRSLESQATLTKAYEALLTDDQMVQQLDVEQLTCRDELPCNLHVLR